MTRALQHDIVVIGASSGGLEALMDIAAGLAADLPAALFIVVHVPAHETSLLPEILARAGRLPAAHAKDGEAIQPGRIYVAPPDFHLLLRDGRAGVVRGPKKNNHRPAIDPLFRSAAQAYGPRAVGVVLSGSLDDGAAGLFSIKNRGGIAIVQDPEDALFPDMPRAALAAVPVDYCLAKKEIAKIIVELSRKSLSDERGEIVTEPNKMAKETGLAALNTDTVEDDAKPGTPSVFGCPDCDGVLWELQDGEWLRFRCRVGHAFSAEGLFREQGESLEAALWSAFRNLHENAALSRRLAERARRNNHGSLADKFEAKSRQAEAQAQAIRDLLLGAKIQAEAENETE